MASGLAVFLLQSLSNAKEMINVALIGPGRYISLTRMKDGAKATVHTAGVLLF